MKLPLVLLVLVGCSPVIVSPYEAEQSACVAEAGTREAADACRCRVKAKFGNPCPTARDVINDAGSDR